MSISNGRAESFTSTDDFRLRLNHALNSILRNSVDIHEVDLDLRKLKLKVCISRTPPLAVRPPKTLHSTLSVWLKNMKKLSYFIDRLQELASAAPLEHRPQLQSEVERLFSTFRRQEERYVEFLRLSEEYADRYLLDISAEIQKQSSFLDMLEKRLDMAKTLHGQAVDIRKSFESGTMDAMKNVCDTALSQPLPEDYDLISEVHFVLGAIRQCYMDLDKFWTEEIRRAVKALETRRVDPDDIDRWRGFKTSLEQTIESWTVTGNNQTVLIRSTSPDNLLNSYGVDLGKIASSLSPALGKLKEALQRVGECASVEFSNLSLRPILQVKLGLTQNSELCLGFWRRCVDFGEIIAALSAGSVTHSAFSRVRASRDLQERVAALRTEAVDISAENVVYPRGSRKFNSVYKQSVSLERKTAAGLNTLLESVSSWIIDVDALSDVRPGGFSLELLRTLADAWAKARTSMRIVLADVTDDPAERLRCRSLSMNPPRPASLMRRCFTRLVDLL